MFFYKKTNKSSCDSSKNIVFLGAFILAFFCFFLVSDVLAAGSGVDSAMSGLKTTAETGYGTSINQVSSSVPELIGKVVGSGLSFIGVLFLLLMIYAGILWMTARGNEQQVAKAQDLIVAAVIGLVIVLSAYAITSYIGNQLTTKETPATVD